jgi:hypothetical protein
MRRLLVIGQGWSAAQFRPIADRLRSRRECSLADVLGELAMNGGAQEIHLFAHWLADDETCAALAARGIALVCHPLESIRAASLVAGQRYRRWAA